MATVAASELQRNFGEWHDKAHEGPVEITQHGRATAYLVSAGLYREIMASYRKSIPIGDLDAATMALIGSAEVATDSPFSLADIPDLDPDPSRGR